MSQSNTKLAENEAVATKRQLNENKQDGVMTLTTGVKVKLHPVGSYVVREAQLRIDRPVVPRAPHPNDPNDKTKYMDNPNDPEYLKALQQYDIDQERVAIDALVLFGIEVVSGFPTEDRKWFRNLKFLGHVEKDVEYDNLDEFETEFLYKKYMIATPPVIMKLSVLSGLSQTEVNKAVDSFQRAEA